MTTTTKSRVADERQDYISVNVVRHRLSGQR